MTAGLFAFSVVAFFVVVSALGHQGWCDLAELENGANWREVLKQKKLEAIQRGEAEQEVLLARAARSREFHAKEQAAKKERERLADKRDLVELQMIQKAMYGERRKK